MDNNTKRIAKNTVYLYIRMGILLLVSLYTSRVMLDKLGVENYGIYNVVGGMAGMFIFFRASLSSASQRFLNIRLGAKDIDGAQRILQQHLTLYLIVAAIVIVVAEPVGLWLLHNKLVIPEGRMLAAEIVFHLCVISLAITLLSIVFDAEIVSNEDMKIYSVVGVIEGFAKLGICYLLVLSPVDTLITYAILLFSVSFFIHLFYMLYALRKYKECKLGLLWDRSLLKETVPIVGWDMYGGMVWMLNGQGINLLLNMFFGPAVNAARGVSNQVNAALSNFTNNIYTALRPQIMKSFAAGRFDYMHQLFFTGTKCSMYVLWLLGLPLMMTIDTVLNIWLTEVPEYTNKFTILVITYSFVCLAHSPLLDIAKASGELKNYMLYGCSIFLLVFPVSYFVLWTGRSPVSVYFVIIILRIGFYLVSLKIVSKIGKFSLKNYFISVFLPFFSTIIPSFIVCYLLSLFLPVDKLWGFFLFVFLSVIVNLLSIWLMGLTRNEREQAKILVMKKVFRK